MLVAVATLFSSFTTPMLASLFSAGFYLVGHLTRDLRELGAQSGSRAVERATALLHRVLPDLEAFNVTHRGRPRAADPGRPRSGSRSSTGRATAAALLLLAAVVFERRDFR